MLRRFLDFIAAVIAIFIGIVVGLTIYEIGLVGVFLRFALIFVELVQARKEEKSHYSTNL